MRRTAGLAVLLVAVTACGGSGRGTLCAGRVSVGEYVLQFGQGLANLDDDVSYRLEADSLSVLDVVLAARDDVRAATDAQDLSRSIAGLIAAMNSHDWIVSAALEDPKATVAADELGTEESLRRANSVEAVVIDECGSVPTVVRPPDTAETLPAPSVPSPTATDPPSEPPDDTSEDRALGAAIGTSFGLTLSADQVLCLGRALRGVTDATGALSGPGQYQAQFQSAFDSCSIAFMVPAS